MGREEEMQTTLVLLPAHKTKKPPLFWSVGSGPKVLILPFLGRLCVGVRAQELRFRDSDKRS